MLLRKKLIINFGRELLKLRKMLCGYGIFCIYVKYSVYLILNMSIIKMLLPNLRYPIFLFIYRKIKFKYNNIFDIKQLLNI